MATATFAPEKIIKRTKGRMVMLYALVDGEEVHMASFFHNEKCQYVLDAIETFDGDVEIEDEDAPKKKAPKTTKKPSKNLKKKKGKK